jgi:hypothetical protein
MGLSMTLLLMGGRRIAIAGIFASALTAGCTEDGCTVIQGDTQVFSGIAEEGGRVEELPRGDPLFILRRGARARVRWRSNLRDQLIYGIEAADGRQGYIFHLPGLGQFALATKCSELDDPEVFKKYLPED